MISIGVADILIGFRHSPKYVNDDILLVRLGTPAVLRSQQPAHIVQMPVVAEDFPLTKDVADCGHAVCRPGMSVILTVLSLGTRVALSFALAPIAGIGELGIWWSIPIGWALADLVGTVYYFRTRQQTVWKE